MDLERGESDDGGKIITNYWFFKPKLQKIIVSFYVF